MKTLPALHPTRPLTEEMGRRDNRQSQWISLERSRPLPSPPVSGGQGLRVDAGYFDEL